MGVLKKSTRAALSQGYKKTLAFARHDVAIKVPKMSQERLIRLACNDYNDYMLSKPDFQGTLASPTCSEWFLERITVNYLRHKLSNYDSHLNKFRGRVGSSGAYAIVKAKSLKAIAERYPWLAEECARQSREQAKKLAIVSLEYPEILDKVRGAE